MAALWTIPETIDYGNIATYLVANTNAKGALFGARIASPKSPVTILMVTDILSWGFDGGAQSSESLRNVANYLRWLIGMYGQQAVNVSAGGGGGSVVPPSGGTLVSPLYITGHNFANATDWNGVNADSVTVLASYTLQVFFNDINRFLIEGTEWDRTASGVTILIPGFDATTTNLDSVFYIFISVT